MHIRDPLGDGKTQPSAIYGAVAAAASGISPIKALEHVR
jgi:hypothetical protein